VSNKIRIYQGELTDLNIVEYFGDIDYSIVEFVTTIFVSLCIEIAGYTGYHEPPELYLITELSIRIFPE